LSNVRLVSTIFHPPKLLTTSGSGIVSLDNFSLTLAGRGSAIQYIFLKSASEICLRNQHHTTLWRSWPNKHRMLCEGT
jgi:hypothetical protein